MADDRRVQPGGALPARLRDVVRLLGKGPSERERARRFWTGPDPLWRPVLAEGPHLIEEALAAGAPITAAVMEAGAEGRHRALTNALTRRDVPVYLVSPEGFATLAATRGPQGVLAVCGVRWEESAAWRPRDAVVVLDGVQDPGNVGAILRTGRAAGVTAFALGEDTARPDDAKTVRASQGAVFWVRLWRGALRTWCETLREGGLHRLVATRPRGGVPPWQVDLRGSVALLLGGEGRGLQEDLDALAEAAVTLPMAGGESLGVAAAAAALLFERARQEEALRRDG